MANEPTTAEVAQEEELQLFDVENFLEKNFTHLVVHGPEAALRDLEGNPVTEVTIENDQLDELLGQLIRPQFYAVGDPIEEVPEGEINWVRAAIIVRGDDGSLHALNIQRIK